MLVTVQHDGVVADGIVGGEIGVTPNPNTEQPRLKDRLKLVGVVWSSVWLLIDIILT